MDFYIKFLRFIGFIERFILYKDFQQFFVLISVGLLLTDFNFN